MLDYVKSPPGADPIIVEGIFPASPADVFAAWTDPDIVKQWFGPVPGSLHAAEIDLRVGGAWRFVKSEDQDGAFGFEGVYLAIKPPTGLRFTWRQFKTHPDGTHETSADSQVDLTFDARDTGTFLRVVHSNIESEAIRKGFAGGWGMGFENLAALLS